MTEGLSQEHAKALLVQIINKLEQIKVQKESKLKRNCINSNCRSVKRQTKLSWLKRNLDSFPRNA